MNREEISKTAYDHFSGASGFHCAEATAKTILDWKLEGSSAELTKAASGFMGGIGGTQAGTCGALTGGIVALGLIYGRNEPGLDIQHIRKLAAEYVSRFENEFGSTNCGVLLDSLEESGNSINCRQLTAEAAGILFDLLSREDEMPQPSQCACSCSC